MPGINSKCFVPGCKSGYKTCTEKVSFFQPPSDPLLLSQWQRAIPRADLVLTRKDRVCEKHFTPELIERKYVMCFFTLILLKVGELFKFSLIETSVVCF
jgi:hypothetical protein